MTDKDLLSNGITLKTEYTGGLPIVYKVSKDGTYFNRSTPDEVINLLELARTLRYYVWFRLGDRNTGRDWMEEYDVCGFVGRSLGTIKVPILLATGRSSGGGGILCDSIVKLVVHGGGRNRRWESPVYQKPELEVVYSDMGTNLSWAVRMQSFGQMGEVQARFTSPQKAKRWVDFVTGRRLNK